ncbi:MAG: hypothetical protein KDB01_21785, partial [Planctomycetaceae bacterium]|nr:hypothetical protein [Planctomycetaceae bacterium]
MLNSLTNWLNNYRKHEACVFGRRTAKRSQANHGALIGESLEDRLLLTVGALDTSFGNGGLQVTDFTPLTGGADSITAISRQDDGKFVVAGVSGEFQDGAIARYNSDGTLDTTFGAGGFVRSTLLEFGGAKDMVLGAASGASATQSIYVTGTRNNDIGVLKITPAGEIDTTFGVSGFAFAGFTTSATAEAITVQTVNNVEMIVAAGHTLIGGSDSDFAVARFNASSGL